MKIRFAVADDAPFIREIIKNLLESDGHICVGEAANGDEAIELVGKVLPDVIFVDIVMPQRNGLHAIRSIRENFPITKIVGCSTLDDSEHIKKAYSVGCDLYITKPFKSLEIRNVINDLFNRSHEVQND